MMRRTPGFTAAALVTLALGIGVNSAIFSVVNGVLLESLPFSDAERLHVVQMLYPDGTRYTSLSAPDFMSVRADARVFEQIEAIERRNVTMLGAGEPREIEAAFVSGGLFDMLESRSQPGGLPSRREQARPRPGRRPRSRALATRLRRRSGCARPIDHERRHHLHRHRRRRARRRAAGCGRAYFPIEFGPTYDANTAQARRSEFLTVLARATTDANDGSIDGDLKRIGAQLQSAFPTRTTA
jgi:hypothetical protein